MIWDLDMLGAIICGAVAITFFALHTITSRRYQQWVTLPEHLRIGIVCAGVLFMLRAIDFCTLSSLDTKGHANAETILTGGVLLYCLISTAVWVAETFRAKREGPQRHVAARD